MNNTLKALNKLVGRGGFEPPTNWLKVIGSEDVFSNIHQRLKSISALFEPIIFGGIRTLSINKLQNVLSAVALLICCQAFAGTDDFGSRSEIDGMAPEMSVTTTPPPDFKPTSNSQACQYKTHCSFSEWHDDWRTADTVREAIFAGMVYIDVRQTLEDLDNPDHEESNPVLGKHPSRKRVIYYSVGGVILHSGVMWLLPNDMRSASQYVSIGLEAMTIRNNYRLGIRIGKNF